MLRALKFHLATFPIIGRNHYERLNSRLDRQINIREMRKNSGAVKNRTKKLFPDHVDMYLSNKQYFFDSSVTQSVIN